MDNLFMALCYLGTFGITGWLWIDAICINQTDVEEKSDLICQMDRIYSNAAKVIGWLGHYYEYVKALRWATSDFLGYFQNHENLDRFGFDWPANSLESLELARYFDVDRLGSALFRV